MLVQVTNEDDVIAALDLAESAFGEPVNTAVNCAGIAYAIKTLSKKGPHQLFQFQQTLTVNTVGSFNVARLAAERYVSPFNCSSLVLRAQYQCNGTCKETHAMRSCVT